MKTDRGAGDRYDAYVICTSPRSGSTLLCKLLASTGVAGNPESYFHEPSVESWAAELSVPADADADEREFLRAVFRAAITAGSLDTGMFGLRLQRHSFDFLMEKLAVLHAGLDRDAERIRAAFGRTLFIHLTRIDKVEQAVSYIKAQQTGLWHVRPDGSELERLKAHEDPAYDAAAIRDAFETMLSFDRQWLRWFEEQRIEPLRLTYEDLASSPGAAVRRVLRELRLDDSAAEGAVAGVRKLSDGINREWADRFRVEHPDLSGRQQLRQRD